MINLVFDTKDSILSEEHLYPIMFALEEAIKSYKKDLINCEIVDYANAVQYWYFQSHYKNKIYDAEKVLNEINEVIRALDYNREGE